MILENTHPLSLTEKPLLSSRNFATTNAYLQEKARLAYFRDSCFAWNAVQRCISVWLKTSKRNRNGLLAPRFARTKDYARGISSARSFWRKLFLKVCTGAFGSHDATRIYSLNSFKRNPVRSQKDLTRKKRELEKTKSELQSLTSAKNRMTALRSS